MRSPCGRAALSAVDPSRWSELRFGFHPSLRRLEFRWNTAAVWQAMSHDETPPEPMAAEFPAPWVLWRQDLQNYFRSMNADEAVALDRRGRARQFWTDL